MAKAQVIGRISRKELRERTHPQRELKVSLGDALKKALRASSKK
jgi:hypothetical protein